MRELPPGLQAHLDGAATTLAWCWRIARRDGVRLGFTDHDNPLAFDGTTFEAATGFTASELKQGLGLSIDNVEVSSALRSDSLNEGDLAAGLFDDARVEIFRVNWSDTSQRVLMRSGSIGEVKRSGPAFTAEIRGLAHYLQQQHGRLYQRPCDADLGDSRCRVDLTTPAFRGTGTVAAITAPRTLTVTGLEAFTAGTLARGVLAWTSGANTGTRIEIKRHQQSAGATTLEPWQDPAHAIVPGNAFTVTIGCDKAFATCRTVFANTLNFRGFPNIPGQGIVAFIPTSGQTNIKSLTL